MKYNAIFQKTTMGFYVIYGEGEVIENNISQIAFEFDNGFEIACSEFSDTPLEFVRLKKGEISAIILLQKSKSAAQRFLMSEVLSKIE